jgi:hypothetical protein
MFAILAGSSGCGRGPKFALAWSFMRSSKQHPLGSGPRTILIGDQSGRIWAHGDDLWLAILRNHVHTVVGNEPTVE